jgi:hypothetical protein
MERTTTKWYERSPGNTSAMRIISMMCAGTGCTAVIGGGALVFLGHPEGAQIATVGAGMAGLGEVAKAWQAKGET